MLRLWKSHETIHINFLPLEKMQQVSQKEFVTICTSLVSNGGDKITREIFNKELCQRNLPGLSIKLTTPNQMMSYIYPIYSGAESDHTNHLMEPQLREGGAVSGQQNYANRLQLKGQLTNYGRLQKALKTDQAWRTSKLS